MPPLLPTNATQTPTQAHRWTAVLAAAAFLTASVIDWNDTWDTARGLAPAHTDSYEWTAADLEGGQTAALPAGDLELRLSWDDSLTITAVRLDSYTDALGTGHRLGIAADTTTAPGTGCLTAQLDSRGEAAQWCARTDQHEPVNMAEFLGKEDDGGWSPDRLYITQTANLDQPIVPPETFQVDYYGFGFDTGDPDQTGIWNPFTSPPPIDHQHCPDPDLKYVLDDLHLTDRYSDPAEHQPHIGLTRSGGAYPEEDRLITPACVQTEASIATDSIASEPFQTEQTSIPLAAVTQAKATQRDPQPIHLAFVIDIRTCDAAPRHCTTDTEIGPNTLNHGIGNDWMTELLGH